MIGEVTDLEAVLVDHLLADDDVAALVDDRVSGDLAPNVSLELPYVTVARLPGISVDRATAHLERARIDVKAWADPDAWETAFDVINAVGIALFAAPESDHAGAVVTAVEYEQTPWRNPDPETDLARYLALFAVFAHPPPGE